MNLLTARNTNANHRVCVCTAFIIMMAIGCDSTFGTRRDLPAPLRNDFPYEISGRLIGIAGGDNLQLFKDGSLHDIVIQGVDTPKSGQAFFQESRLALIKLTQSVTVRATVIGRDPHQREIAFVHVPGNRISGSGKSNEALPNEMADVGFEIIKVGLGWYDGSDFPNADQYRAAEKAARIARVGLWSDANPIAPWDFENQE